MFKNKVNIIESTLPPSNINDWWFDLNEQKLKRFKEGEWSLYNYTWPKIPYALADNEILIRMNSIEDLGGYGESAIKTEFSKCGTVKEVKYVFDEMANMDLYYVIFAEALTTLNVSKVIGLFDNICSTIDLYFPASLTNITTSNYLFRTSSEGAVNVYFANLHSFSGALFNFLSSSYDVYIYSKQVAQISSNFMNYDSVPYIHVPKELESKYKQSTNWNQYNIVAID